MEIDPNTLAARDRHLLLTALVVPRPIGWISSLAADGAVNLAPYSFFNLVSSQPPTLMVSVGQRDGRDKDTLANARTTAELVVNVVSDELAEAMNASAVESGPEHDEFAFAGVTPVASQRVRAPRVAEARAHLEARVVDIRPIEDDDGVARNHVIFARIVHVHVVDALFTPPHRVDVAGLAPLARLAGAEYSRMGERFSIPRPELPKGA